MDGSSGRIGLTKSMEGRYHNVSDRSLVGEPADEPFEAHPDYAVFSTGIESDDESVTTFHPLRPE
jgi:hypothetical protein